MRRMTGLAHPAWALLLLGAACALPGVLAAPAFWCLLMDSSRFDQITRGMATGSSRRALLKGLAGGLLADASGWSEVVPVSDDIVALCRLVPRNASTTM